MPSNFFKNFRIGSFLIHLIHAVILLITAGYVYSVSLKSGASSVSFGTRYIFLVLSVLTAHWFIHLLILISSHRRNICRWIADNGAALFGILLITVMIFLTVKSECRVQNDAANRMSAALSLWYQHTFSIIDRGYWNGGQMFIINQFFPDRPPMFQYLLALIHTGTGYRFENVYIFNFFNLYILLVASYALLRQYFSRVIALSAVVFIVSNPIVVLDATSDDYGILYAALMILSFYLFMLSIKYPGKIMTGFVLLCAVMMSQVRPESIAVGSVLIAAVMIAYLIKFGFRYFSYTVFWIPILMIPSVWVRVGSGGKYAGIQINRLGVKNETGFIEYLVSMFQKSSGRMIDFARVGTDFKPHYPYADAVITAGAAGLAVFFLKCLFSGKKSKDGILIFMVIALTFLSYWIIVTLFGPPLDRRTCRYYIVACIFLSAFAAYLMDVIRLKKAACIIFALMCFSYYHTESVKNDIHKKYSTWAESYQIAMSYLSDQDMENILVLSRFPKQYMPHRYSALQISLLRRKKMTYFKNLVQKEKFKDVYVVRRVKLYGDGSPYRGYRLPEFLEYETLFKQKKDRYSAIEVARISNIHE